MTDKMLSLMHPNSINLGGFLARARNGRRKDRVVAVDGIEREYLRLWSYAQDLTRQSEVRPDLAVVYTPGEDSTFWVVQTFDPFSIVWIASSVHADEKSARVAADDLFVGRGAEGVRVVRIGPEAGAKS